MTERKFRFAVVSCQGAVGCLYVVRGTRSRSVAEAAAWKRMEATFDTSVCDQCFSDGWSLLQASMVSITDDDEVIELDCSSGVTDGEPSEMPKTD